MKIAQDTKDEIRLAHQLVSQTLCCGQTLSEHVWASYWRRTSVALGALRGTTEYRPFYTYSTYVNFGFKVLKRKTQAVLPRGQRDIFVSPQKESASHE